ncbi:hypothetical protein ACTHO0_03630 [Cytobacillus praedii]|uniref:hypothetical protein n=1 Tax=Cytobacillus praedii TaxID=1742358 RepID=UPI002E1D8B6D|nr:hypothetical protein [Cytobacillus praedii]
MTNLDNSNFKINFNGKEINGENAREFADKISKNLGETLNGLVSNKLSNLSANPMSGNLLNSVNPLKNLNGIFSQNPLGSNGVQNMLPALSKLLPVFETSDDNKKIKLSLNGVTLLDLDLTDLTDSNNSTEEK